MIPVNLSVIGKRTHEWTGVLHRVFREFLDATQIRLSEKEFDSILNLPDGLIDLVQAGVVQAVELEAGRDGLSITLTQDPDAPDELNTSMLPLCDLAGPRLEIRVVVEDEPLATALGAGRLTKLSTARIGISVWTTNAWSQAQAARPSGKSRPSLHKPEVHT
jgi:hypothetical protein